MLKIPALLHVGEISPQDRWHMAPHLHPFHEIIVVMQGRLNLKIENEAFAAGPGDVLFYHAGRVHEEVADPRHPLATQYLSMAAGSAMDLPTRIQDEGGRVRQLMPWLHQAFRDQAAPELTFCLLQAILLQIQHLAQLRESPWLTDLRHRMRENLSQDLDLNALALWAGMSKFAFARKFKRLSGRSPIQDLRFMRLDDARSLLLTTNYPLKHISQVCHLGDESQLSKLFHRHFRLWPSEIRMRPKSGHKSMLQ